MEITTLPPEHIAITQAWEEKLAALQVDSDEWTGSAEQLHNTRLVWTKIKQKANDTALAPSCGINEYGSAYLSWALEGTQALIRIKENNIFSWFFSCASTDKYCMHYSCGLREIDEFIDNLCEFFAHRLQQP